MLTKDPKSRIKLKDLLQHPWIVKKCPEVQKMRKDCTKGNEFRMFSLTNPGTVKIYDEVKRRSNEVSKTTPPT